MKTNHVARRVVRCVWFLLLLGAWSFGASAYAQDNVRQVTLEEALQLFAQNNLQLRMARAEAAQMRGLARRATPYPNPAATVTHEPLSSDGMATSETYVNLSQRFLWPGLRAARREAARGVAEATRAGIKSDSLRLAADVARAYVEATAVQDRVADLRTVIQVFRRADSSSTALRREGEISGYDLRRLRVERARYENALAQAKVDAQEARQRLAMLVVPDGETVEVAPVASLQMTAVDVSLETSMRQARARRPELIRARAAIASTQASLRAARKERLPDPTFTAGYKRQSNGFQGAFLGLSTPLPLFDQNEGQIAADQARLHAAQTQLRLTERQIENDVRLAYAQYASMAERIELIQDDLLTEADDLLSIARVSYGEGEMSLLELLDATEAYRDTRITSIDLLADYWTSYYDLVRATAGDFTALTP